MPLWTQKMLYLSEFKADESRLNYRTIDSTVNGGGGVRRGGELKWMRLVYAADPLSPNKYWSDQNFLTKHWFWPP